MERKGKITETLISRERNELLMLELLSFGKIQKIQDASFKQQFNYATNEYANFL